MTEGIHFFPQFEANTGVVGHDHLLLYSFKFFINPLKPSGYYVYHPIQHTETLRSADRVCVYHVVLTINSDCFPKQL
jgi:hypothetical protein